MKWKRRKEKKEKRRGSPNINSFPCLSTFFPFMSTSRFTLFGAYVAFSGPPGFVFLSGLPPRTKKVIHDVKNDDEMRLLNTVKNTH